MQALYNLLSSLPMALPLAMGHTAADEVTAALRKVMTPVDARRIDKLYRVAVSYTHLTLPTILLV